MGVINSLIEQKVAEATERALRSAPVQKAIDDVIWERLSRPGIILQRWAFKALVAGRIKKEDRSLTRARCYEIAECVCVEVEKDAGEWGAPGYGWDMAAAHTVAEAYEIDYWDLRP